MMLDVTNNLRQLDRMVVSSLADEAADVAGQDDNEDPIAFEMHCSDVENFLDGTPEGNERACTFVKERCTPRGGLINYLELPYCWMNTTPAWVSGLILLVWVTLLFIWLTAMVEFLVPSLTAISNLCNFRESVAGVTFLAFANGSSDIFSMCAATVSGVNGMDLAIGEVLGNGMFLFCGVQGIIALFFPFSANGAEYVRDCAFYFASILLMFLVLLDGHISLLEGVLFLLVYAVYILVVVRFEHILRLFGCDPKHFGLYEDDSGIPGREEGGYEDLADGAELRLADFLSPVTRDAFAEMEWYEKVVCVIKYPAVLLLKLTVPVVDMKLPQNGWCRKALCLQLLLFPGMVGLMLVRRLAPSLAVTSPPSLAALAAGLLCGAFLAVAVWWNSDDDMAPPFHKAMSFVGFVAAVLWIYITAEEIVNVILAFGVLFELGKVSLGITILAIGIGFQDLVSNVGVARGGYATMAAGACVGSPMLNILLGVGFSAIVGNVVVAAPYPIRLTLQILVCLLFLFCSVGACLLFMWFSHFNGGVNLGILLLTLYVVFMGFAIAADFTQGAYGIRYLN